MPYRNVSFGTAVPSFTTNVYICTNMADEHTELEEDKEDGELEEGEAPPEPKAAKRRR